MEEKKIIGRPFQPGNPGRPPGSRNKLQEDFLRDFCKAWEQYGWQSLERTAIDEPATFVKVAAAILPKEIKAEVEHRAVMRMPAPAESADQWMKEVRQDVEEVRKH